MITAEQARQKMQQPQALMAAVGDLSAAIESNADSGTPTWPIVYRVNLTYELAQRAAAEVRGKGFICEVVSWWDDDAQIWVTMSGLALDEHTLESGRRLRSQRGVVQQAQEQQAQEQRPRAASNTHDEAEAIVAQNKALLDGDHHHLAARLESLNGEQLIERYRLEMAETARFARCAERTKAFIRQAAATSQERSRLWAGLSQAAQDDADDTVARFAAMELDYRAGDVHLSQRDRDRDGGRR